MKSKAFLFILFIFAAADLYCAGKNSPVFVKKTNSSFNQLIINNNDSIIFNLTNATLTATYIDIPVCIKSDDPINSFNYALTFNLSKLTYSTIINVLTNDPSYSASAYFNPNDLFLRFTCSTNQGLPSNGTACVSVIRFALSAPCVSITTADFSNVLTLLNGTQCSYRLSNINFAQFIPIADFDTGPTCLNTFVQFSDSSDIGNGIIIDWAWSFGNGSTSSLKNNIITFDTTGTSATTLIVSALNGCKDTIIKQITINEPPISSFTHTFDCSKDTVFFTNTSTVPSGSIISFQWYFGDLSSLDYTQNPSHNYILNGFYNVILTTTSNNSCSSVIKERISLLPGDINRDGIADVDDFLILAPAIGTTCD